MSVADAAQLVSAIVSAVALIVLVAQFRHAQQEAADAKAATAAAQTTSAAAVTQAARIADALAIRERAELVASLRLIAVSCAGVGRRLEAALLLVTRSGNGETAPGQHSHSWWVTFVREMPGELRTCSGILVVALDRAAVLEPQAAEGLVAAKVRIEGLAVRVTSLESGITGVAGSEEMENTRSIAHASLVEVVRQVANAQGAASQELARLDVEAARRATSLSGTSDGIRATTP